MKFEVKIYSLQSDHIFATPKYDHSRFIKAESREQLERYIKDNMKDEYGHPYHIEDREPYTHTSSAGGLRVENYEEIKFETIWGS